jgi:hypothetical protein
MTNNKQQTAIDWLIDEHFGGIENVTLDFKKHIEQAKEMEKEQIIEAYHAAVNLEYCLDMVSPREYYEQTYGGKK